MPDLIIADGGKGQMGVIHEVLERSSGWTYLSPGWPE